MYAAHKMTDPRSLVDSVQSNTAEMMTVYIMDNVASVQGMSRPTTRALVYQKCLVWVKAHSQANMIEQAVFISDLAFDLMSREVI